MALRGGSYTPIFVQRCTIIPMWTISCCSLTAKSNKYEAPRFECHWGKVPTQPKIVVQCCTVTLCPSSGGYLLHASNVWLLTKDDVSLVYGALPKNHHHHEPPQLLVGHHNSQMSYPIFQMSNHICQWATTTAIEPPYIPNISIQNWATASSWIIPFLLQCHLPWREETDFF